MLEALVSAKDWLTIVQDKDKDKDDEEILSEVAGLVQGKMCHRWNQLDRWGLNRWN
ncbi:hypothetical protein PVAP13_3KG127160 [Panicum virgatum]|uniref:Uncharacterized protein n=1 Tax=Panicum virgatum TaxID=38727 RepID=A0A8T0UZA9_PANVG|nr:hypothetical protein PVAP13_3KG127160 [Panicum virgatum]